MLKSSCDLYAQELKYNVVRLRCLIDFLQKYTLEDIFTSVFPLPNLQDGLSPAG